MMELLSEYRSVTVVIHAIAAAIGLGGATMSDILFFRFLRNGRISPTESDALRTISRVLWVTITIIVLSGIGIYLPAAERLNASSKFLLKVVVVAVIIANGACLHLFIAPKLTRISFTAQSIHDRTIRRLRRFAFAFGSISIVSWYTAFLLGSIRGIPLSFPALVGLYAFLLAGAVAGSQCFEHVLTRRKTKTTL